MTGTALLCGDRAPAGADSLDGIEVIPGLCAEPDAIAATEVEGPLILGLCRGDYSPGLVQALLGRAGRDALTTPIVDLRAVAGRKERLEVMMAGAMARMSVPAASRDLKAVFGGSLSRRDLLRFPQPEYVAVPVIDRAACAAENGCQACVTACPRQAYEWRPGVIAYDKDACEPCGICVTACPVDAISNAAVDRLGDELSALVAAAAGPIGIAFMCRRATKPVDAEGWYPVEVPCNSMVVPHWLLAALAAGVGAVAAPLCSDVGCSLGYDDTVASNVDYCRRLLAASGQDHERMATDLTATVPAPLPLGEVPDAFTQPARSLVLVAIAPDGALLEEHPAAPIGTVEIDPSACTGCRLCAETCPTGALQLADGDGTLVISFETTLCTACDQCTPRCPEPGAISLSRRTDLATLAAGRVELYRESLLSCERCGKPIASAVMMDRFADMLGPEQEGVMSVISRLCIDCRGSR